MHLVSCGRLGSALGISRSMVGSLLIDEKISAKSFLISQSFDGGDGSSAGANVASTSGADASSPPGAGVSSPPAVDIASGGGVGDH